MTIIKFPKKQWQKNQPFFSDIKEYGYHVYNLEKAKTPNFYPPELIDYFGVPLKDLKEGDVITVMVFFGVGKGADMRIDSGYVDLRVEDIFFDGVTGVIITEMPKIFPLSNGDGIDVFEEEILSKAENENY